jgi:2-(1,2-epoxy-1,2-dihydrophenyl)acetyl-CoA isomerase
MSSPVIYKVEDQIGHIILNRPSTLNALTEDLVLRVIEALRVAEDDPDVKVVILSGEGPAFCSGTDLEVLTALDNASETSKWIEMTASLTKTIVDLDKYVIAAVQGSTAGAGFSLALASDFIIAERAAEFALNFANLGLIPDLGLTKHLVDHLPLPIAKEWISSGKVITAEEAYSKGMVNRIVTHNLIQEAIDFSKFIIKGAPLCNKYVKHLLNRAKSSNLDVALMNENMVQTVLLKTVDYKEAVTAKLEKRMPLFTGN